MPKSILNKNSFFFAGIAGVGMSAIAQFLSGNGKHISGSDRLFNTTKNDYLKQQLESACVKCYSQTEAQISEKNEVLVVSTAIEDSNVEVQKAKKLNIPIVTRAQLLAQICREKRCIAIAGTSGKSSTAAMLFHILTLNNIDVNLITGAGIVSLIKKGKIGNCHVGSSDWLIIEADESDGSLVEYTPEIGVLLSIDKDHKELDELDEIFQKFKNNVTDTLICNQNHPLSRAFSTGATNDFGKNSPINGKNFSQSGFEIKFEVNDVFFKIPCIGKHNMENALACIAVATKLGLSLKQCATALQNYPGIYRRHQLLGVKNGICVIDDYAHNPAKIVASLLACQPVSDKLIAWFQPHGYKPTKFIRSELVHEIAATLRPNDEIWMSEIYYAGGTAVKDISALDLINDLKNRGVNAYFVENRYNLLKEMRTHFSIDCTLLLMGARDPSLEQYGKDIYKAL